MKKYLRIGSLLTALLLLLGSMTGVLAADSETTKQLDTGTETFTYTLYFDTISEEYASAQFDITISDKSELDITSIEFSDDITDKASGTSDTLNLDKNKEITDGEIVYQAGYCSTENQYGSETEICTVTFSYTGSSEETVTFDNLQVWQLVYDEDGLVTDDDGIPELEMETISDWSRTVNVSRDDDDDSGSSGGGSTGDEPDITNTTADDTTTTSGSVSGTTDSSGKTTVTIDDDMGEALVEYAKEAEKNGKKSVVKVTVEGSDDETSVEVTVPKDTFDALADETEAAIAIETETVTVTFDAEAVEVINDADTTGDVTISIATADTSSLTEEDAALIGDRPVYDFTVTSGTTQVSSFGDGMATVCIQYTPSSDEDENAIIVYYIDDSGNLQTVRGCYNSETGMVEFVTDHFSVYAVGYNMVTFSDVADTAWYEDAVTFAAARGITTGTGDGLFSPDNTLTRAQFIVMLMRAYGIDAEENPTDNFDDAGDTYYTNYLATAKSLGISNGIGDNMFAPDSEITRQDMFTLLYRALNVLGELPEETETTTVDDFSDKSEISDYALDAMQVLVKGGIVSGSDGQLEPLGSSTRAQMAQVIYNLLSV